MGRVAGKVAIITGAASAGGLGFATARALSREGAKVVLADIDIDGVTARSSEINELGGQAIGCHHDVTIEAHWQRVVALTVETFGSLDILVNNAGIASPAPMHEMQVETWDRVVDVNLMGTFLGCKHAVIQMRRQPAGGSVINVASISGLLGFPGSAAYGASKGGIRSLSKVVALEGARQRIRCNSIYPGLILTDLLLSKSREAPDQTEALAASIPMGRIGEPDEIANTILFLGSNESSYITGSEIVVDGGLIAQ